MGIVGLKIVVAAAVSQIGYWILKLSTGRGNAVTAGYHRRRFATPVGDETWTAIDLQHPDSELTGGPDSQADIFVHCGPPQLSPNAARLAAAMRCRSIVAFGSTSVLYHDLPRPQGDPLKAAMLRRLEQEFTAACRHHRIAGTLFRPTMVYGTGMDQNVCRLARVITRSPVIPLPFGADGLRQPIHAADIAEIALKAAAETATDESVGKVRIIDIGGGEQLPYRTLVRRIGNALDRNPMLVPCPGLAQVARLAASARPSLAPTASALFRMKLDQVVDNTAASQTFGFQPRGFTPTRAELLGPLHPLAG